MVLLNICARHSRFEKKTALSTTYIEKSTVRTLPKLQKDLFSITSFRINRCQDLKIGNYKNKIFSIMYTVYFLFMYYSLCIL